MTPDELDPPTRMRPWFVPVGNRSPRTAARARLICVPNAGGGAATFHGWDELPFEDIEVLAVRLPGRETRIRETPLTHIHAVVEALADALMTIEPLPFAVFGHSMGAVVSFELTRTLRRRGRPTPLHLFVSGWGAPQLPRRLPRLHGLSTDELLAVLRRLNGVPAAVLDNLELMALLLPILRADVAVAESYTHTEEPPLQCPISAFGGQDDPTTTPETMAAWSDLTCGGFRLRMLPGDHFFIHAQRMRLLTAIQEDLADLGLTRSGVAARTAPAS